MSGAISDSPPFHVEVLINDLRIRETPSTSGTVRGYTGRGVFTITEVKGEWGRLKSGAGWIYIANTNYCKIVESQSDILRRCLNDIQNLESFRTLMECIGR